MQAFFLDVGFKTSTRERRLRCLDTFAVWVEERLQTSWTKIDWSRMRELVDARGRHLAWLPVDAEFIAEFLAQGPQSDGARCARIDALKGYFRHLVARDLLSDNPLEFVPYPKVHRPEMQALTAKELRAVVQSAYFGRHPERNKTLVTMYAWGGYRKSEPLTLRVGDLDRDEGAIRLTGTKARRYERRLLPEPAGEVVDAWLRSPERPVSPWLFPGRNPARHLSSPQGWAIVREAGQRADIARPVTPQLLRHTVATLLYRNGMSLQEVSELLGHSSWEITRRYLERRPRPGAAREALARSRLTRLLDHGLI